MGVLGLTAIACSDAGAGEEDGSGELTVVVWPEGEQAGSPVSYTLGCEPAGGTLPDAEAACGQLNENRDALEPVPAGVACTEIYGGPHEARVTGTLDGEQVDARFSRANGCEIDRWERLALLFPVDLNAWAE